MIFWYCCMTNQTRFGANLIEYRKILKFLKSGIQLIGIRGKTPCPWKIHRILKNEIQNTTVAFHFQQESQKT